MRTITKKNIWTRLLIGSGLAPITNENRRWSLPITGGIILRF